MLVLIKLILINVMMVLAWRTVISKDMLLEELGEWGESKVKEGHKIYDLIVCPWCCGSLFAIPSLAIGYALGVVELSWMLLLYYPLTLFGTSFIAGFMWTIYTTVNAIKEKVESEKKYYDSAEINEHFDLKDRKEKFKQRNQKERSY